jgi:hypothetical protein
VTFCFADFFQTIQERQNSCFQHVATLSQPRFCPSEAMNFLDNKSQRTMTLGFAGGCTSRDRSVNPPLLQFRALPPVAITRATSMGCAKFCEAFPAPSIGSTHASFRSHPWGEGAIFLSRF